MSSFLFITVNVITTLAVANLFYNFWKKGMSDDFKNGKNLMYRLERFLTAFLLLLYTFTCIFLMVDMGGEALTERTSQFLMTVQLFAVFIMMRWWIESNWATSTKFLLLLAFAVFGETQIHEARTKELKAYELKKVQEEHHKKDLKK